MTRAAAAALGTAALGLPLAAAAAEGGGGETRTLLWAAFNLVLLLGVLFAFARKPIRAFFAERRDRVKSDLDQAARLHAEAQQRLVEWNRKLLALDAELERIRETARSRAAAERERILADAESAATRIRAEAGAAVEHELRRARRALHDEAAALAVELAAERLRDAVTADDRNRLLDEFVERIAAGDADSGERARAGR